MSYLELLTIGALSMLLVAVNPTPVGTAEYVVDQPPAVIVSESIVEDNYEEAPCEEAIEDEALITPQVRYQLTAYERTLVEKAVMSESGYEPYEGQLMIAQCILDGAERNGFDIATSIKKYRIVASDKYEITDSVRQAVSAVFDEGQRATEAKADIWYAPKYCSSSWHESQQYVATVGGHKFFWCNRNAN